MKAPILYKIASILLVLFAVGHTFGFRRLDPRWGVESLVASMRTMHFKVDSIDRTYYDFYEGFGFFVTLLLLFAALVSWQLGGLSHETLTTLRIVTWGFAACFVGVTALSWLYFFVAPIVFSIVISAVLILAAWMAGATSTI